MSTPKHGTRPRVKRAVLPPPQSPYFSIIAGNVYLRDHAIRLARRCDGDGVRALQRSIAIVLVDAQLARPVAERQMIWLPTFDDVCVAVVEVDERAVG